jgi:hypothetical protein
LLGGFVAWPTDAGLALDELSLPESRPPMGMRSDAGSKAKKARMTAAVPAIEMSHDAHGLIRSSLDRAPVGVHHPSWG